MMNAELVPQSQFKIILPNVHRDSYLNGLRLASRDKNFRTYIKVMDQAQAYTASVNWLDYGEARETLEKGDANLSPDEGIPTFNRVLKTFVDKNKRISQRRCCLEIQAQFNEKGILFFRAPKMI